MANVPHTNAPVLSILSTLVATLEARMFWNFSVRVFH